MEHHHHHHHHHNHDNHHRNATSAGRILASHLIINQHSWRGSCLVLLLTIVASAILANNLYHATHMLYHYRRRLFLFNVIPPLIGILASVTTLLTCVLPWYIDCSSMGYAYMAALTIGTPIMTTILIIKVYTGVNQLKRFKVLGTIAVASQLAIGVVGYFSMHFYRKRSGICMSTFKLEWMLAKLTIDIFTNLILIIGFAHVLWPTQLCQRQRLHDVLVRDGFIYAVWRSSPIYAPPGLPCSSRSVTDYVWPSTAWIIVY
ncbi:hypothetical protein BDF22DRAFT_777152 [Syncephalis plumigaleata]|nr:hypothetical protein BDF22DRAFT_777152 [Syncephalis plumigaleata]